MTGLRLLLTGATGFVGRQVLSNLSSPVDIHCISRKAANNYGHKATWHQADLLDTQVCQQLVAKIKPDILVHLSWITEHGAFWESRENTDWYEAGLSLAHAFGKSGGRRIIISGTCAEYATNAPSPLDEYDTPISPVTRYGKMKTRLFNDVQALSREYGFSFAWPRIFIPFGAHEKPGRLVPSIISSLLDTQPALCSSGTQVRDFMDVRDLGAALGKLALSDISGPINLGSGQQITISELAMMIGKLMGHPELIKLGALSDRPGEPVLQIPKLDRMKNELEFTPRIPLEQGLRETIDYWKDALSTPAVLA